MASNERKLRFMQEAKGVWGAMDGAARVGSVERVNGLYTGKLDYLRNWEYAFESLALDDVTYAMRRSYEGYHLYTGDGIPEPMHTGYHQALEYADLSEPQRQGFRAALRYIDRDGNWTGPTED